MPVIEKCPNCERGPMWLPANKKTCCLTKGINMGTPGAKRRAEEVRNLPVDDRYRPERGVREGRGVRTVAEDIARVPEKLQEKTLKKKYEAMVREVAVWENVWDRMEQVIPVLPTVKVPKSPKISEKKTVESVALAAACWHIGETVDFGSMGGLNEYNFEIFTSRLQRMIEKAISFCHRNMKEHVFEEFHLMLLGDMVSGIIHDELLESNEMHIVDQTMVGALVTAQAIMDLARAFPKVVVTGVPGNHGRTQKQKQYKDKGSKSFDYMFYNILAMMLKDQKNVEFNIPRSYWAILQIQGFNFQLMHGDTVRSWGGIPFYGLNREMNKWTEIHAIREQVMHYYVSAHYHTKAVLQSGVGERIMTGSLKGGDEYAIGLGLYSDPVQLLFGIHRDHGKTWELTLNMKGSEGVTDPRYVFDARTPVGYQLDWTGE